MNCTVRWDQSPWWPISNCRPRMLISSHAFWPYTRISTPPIVGIRHRFLFGLFKTWSTSPFRSIDNSVCGSPLAACGGCSLAAQDLFVYNACRRTNSSCVILSFQSDPRSINQLWCRSASTFSNFAIRRTCWCFPFI